jgi:hypothetical protein
MIDKTYTYGDKFTAVDYNRIIDELILTLKLIAENHKTDALYFSTLIDELKTCYAKNYFDILKSENTNKIIAIANVIAEYEKLGTRIDRKLAPGDVLDPNVFNKIISIINKVQAKCQKSIN